MAKGLEFARAILRDAADKLQTIRDHANDVGLFTAADDAAGSLESVHTAIALLDERMARDEAAALAAKAKAKKAAPAKKRGPYNTKKKAAAAAAVTEPAPAPEPELFTNGAAHHEEASS